MPDIGETEAPAQSFGSVQPAVLRQTDASRAVSLVGVLARRFWVPAAYLVLTFVLTWPLAINADRMLLGTIDPQLQAWNLAWNVHAFTSDPQQIWQAPIFFPYPDTLAYTDNFILLSLLVAPIIWLTGNHVLALNLLVLLSFVLTGWAVYDLTRDLIRGRGAQTGAASPSQVSRLGLELAEVLPAFVAGAAFAFGAYRFGHIVHLHMLQTMWLPWALLFLRRLLGPVERGGARWRDALLCGLFTGLQAATSIYYTFFAAALLGGYGLVWALVRVWRWLRRRERLPWATLGHALVAVVVALAIAGPLLVPYARVYATLGIVRSARELENWSAPIRAYLSVSEVHLWQRLAGLPFGEAGELTLFPGLLVTLLGLGALLLPRRWFPFQERLFWLLVLVGAFVLSLGTALRWERGGSVLPVPLPYVLLYTYLPGAGALRVPARWGVLVALALAVLAGVALSRMLTRVGGRARLLLGGAALLVAIGETLAVPLPMVGPVLGANVPPVYHWLGAPAQSDIGVVLELPAPKLPRGPDLERIVWRQFHGVYHWKQLPVSYSGLIPFGTTDLLGIIQRLPDEETLRYLQLIGVDTLVVHANEYDQANRQKLLDAFDQSPLLQPQATIGEASVYRLLPSSELTAIAPTNGDESIIISDHEQLPGVLALALKRRWEAQGFALYGPGRVRYYGPLAVPRSGQVFDYGLLAADEDPAPYGFTASGIRWRMNGLAFYAADPALHANLGLGRVEPGRFHPTYPDTLSLVVESDHLHVGEQTATWEGPLTEPLVVLDLASLRAQTLQVGGHSFALPAGTSTITAPVTLGQSLTVEGQPGAIAFERLRLRSGAANPLSSPTGQLAASADVAFDGTRLKVNTAVGGAGELVLDVWGAAAYDDKPVHLLGGAQPIPADGGPLTFEVDLLAPAAPWLGHTAAAVDGRYEVYLRSANQQVGRGIPIATFTLRNGTLVEPQAVLLPLATLPR